MPASLALREFDRTDRRRNGSEVSCGDVEAEVAFANWRCRQQFRRVSPPPTPKGCVVIKPTASVRNSRTVVCGAA